MQCLEVSGVVRPIYGSLGVKLLIYPSSGACDCVVQLPHQSSCSQFVVCWSLGVAGVEWCSFCRLKHKLCFILQNKHHQIPAATKAPTQRTENKTTDVVIHQHSRKLLKIDILMPETCWAHNKWNKIASDIKLVFHSSNENVIRFLLISLVFWWQLHYFNLDCCGNKCLYFYHRRTVSTVVKPWQICVTCSTLQITLYEKVLCLRFGGLGLSWKPSLWYHVVESSVE